MIYGIILISGKTKDYPISRESIIRIEACGDDTVIVTDDKKQHVHNIPLGELEKKLSDNFFRSHHSHIMNMKCIKFIQRGRSYLVEMSDGCHVPVSQRKVAEFRKRLAM